MNDELKLQLLKRDQPEQEDVLPRLIADLQARSDRGTEIYGGPLQTNNGLNALREAYEEALDLAQYLCQALMETESRGT